MKEYSPPEYRTDHRRPPCRVTAIEAELQDLRSFRTQVTQFMQQRPPK
jgi:hypothetical protein